MNGEVNGTVDEAMDTSDTESPVGHKKILKEECNKINEHSENSNEDEKTTDEQDFEPINIDDMKFDVHDDNESEAPDTDTSKKDSEQSDSPNSSYCTDKKNIADENETKSVDVNCVSKLDKVLECKEKDDSETMTEKFKDTQKGVSFKDEESDEMDSEEDSSDEDVLETISKVEDAVSINSDSDSEGEETSREGQTDKNDIIIIDNEIRTSSLNGSSCGVPSPEIHEILSDNDEDCIVTKDEKIDKDNLRRSSRGVKRKRYDEKIEINGDEEESDVEEVILEDPLKKKTKPILISDTRSLVDMAVKQTKINQGNQRKENSLVIESITSGRSPLLKKSQAASSPKGVNVKTSVTSTQPVILPSLTDDMFVVEAPSFIVPYVYEKPSLKPFREFVDVLGRELEEQKIQEEKKRLEKEKEEKEKRDKEKMEKRERGEEVADSDEEREKDEEAKKKKEQRRERRRRKKEEDDASWDGESSSDSEDEILSDEEDKTVVLKNKLDSMEDLKDVTPLTVEKLVPGKSDNYFDCSLGKFFMNIGLNLVQEFVQTDLLKQQNRKLYREKKAGHSTKSTESSIASLMKNLDFSKENNAPYAFKLKKCEHCSFKTDSSLVMSNHLETPHMKNNMYKCNFCTFEVRTPHEILFHMEAEHNIQGKLERALSYHQCPNCPFEDNGKGKLARHSIPCSKKFKPELNLAPPVEWEPPAKIPKITRAKNTLSIPYGGLGRGQGAGGRVNALSGPGPAGGKPRARAPILAAGRAPTLPRPGLTVRPAPPGLLPTNFGINNGKTGGKSQPSISITPLPRQPQPSLHLQVAKAQNQGKASFVICEICDGYIKDLEQLRNHMQWIHKVKIHPKMIHNRPPLNCQKCQFRFFTDQGLERHLLGSHGLVTSSMQEAANKGKDAGRCPVCGRVYQWKLLAHVAKDHNLTLKPAHLSYKCTVCTATFGMYKQFESHVYSAHSVVAKRVVEKGEAPSQSKGSSNNAVLKSMKINDEITIIPQPVKAAASKTK